MTPPHPCNFFSVRLALLGCTAGLHVALLRLCTGPCLARAHDKLCVSVIANQNSRFTYRQGVRFDRAPPSLTRQAIAPQPETMLTQCWPLCSGQCGYVVTVKGLQVGH